MTTTPQEPETEPTVVPSGDPGVGPDESEPDAPVAPTTDPAEAPTAPAS